MSLGDCPHSKSISMSCSFCGLSFLSSLHFPMHCGFLASEFRKLSTFYNKNPCLVPFVVCFCHAVLYISMHCGLLVGEFNEFSCIESKVYVLICVFGCALLPISMHCGLLAGEFGEFLCIESNLHVLFILWFSLPCFLANFNTIWITRW